MRLIPQLAHYMSRVPIPKPETDKERRPNIVAEDLVCLKNSFLLAPLDILSTTDILSTIDICQLLTFVNY